MGDRGGESGGGERERGGGGKKRGDKGWGWKVVERDYQIPSISIIYSILKYKEKRLITKQLKKNGIIQNKEESSKISWEFYKILLNWNDKMTQRWFRNNMNYEIDAKRGLLKTANGKAVGIYKVPG